MTVRAAAVAALVVACAVGPSTIRGVVVDVDGDLTGARSFTVLANGRQVILTPADDGDFAFPLPHLRDHLRSGEPVEVDYEERDGELVAIAIRDG